MKRRVLILRLTAALMGAPLLLAADVLMAPVDPPKPAPELQFMDGDGKSRSLAEFKGKVVLLNIWVTWCVPCRKEMPTLDGLQAALGGPDFEVVTLSIDHKGMEAVDPFYSEIGIQYLGKFVTASGNDAMEKLGVFGIPATYLIDRQELIIAQKQGPAEWDSSEFVAYFKFIISKSKETNP